MCGKELAVLALPSGHIPPGIRLSQWKNRPTLIRLLPLPRVASPLPGLCYALAGGGALRCLGYQGRTQEFLSHGFFSVFPSTPSAPRSGCGWAFGQGLRTDGTGCQGGDEASGSLLSHPGLDSTSTQECKFLNQVSQALALGRGRVAAVR